MDEPLFQVVCEYETGIKRRSRLLTEEAAGVTLQAWRREEPMAKEIRVETLALLPRLVIREQPKWLADTIASEAQGVAEALTAPVKSKCGYDATMARLLLVRLAALALASAERLGLETSGDAIGKDIPF